MDNSTATEVQCPLCTNPAKFLGALPEALVCSHRSRFQNNSPWNSRTHLYVADSAAAHFIKKAQQPKHLIAQDKVHEQPLRAWFVVRIQLHVFLDHRCRIEYRLRVCDPEAFNRLEKILVADRDAYPTCLGRVGSPPLEETHSPRELADLTELFTP